MGYILHKAEKKGICGEPWSSTLWRDTTHKRSKVISHSLWFQHIVWLLFLHKFYSDSFSQFSPVEHFQFSAPLLPSALKNFKCNTNHLFLFLESCFFLPLSPLESSHCLSLPVTNCVFVALSPCWGWNDL